MQIDAVNPEDLEILWDALPLLQEQTCGGLRIGELKLSPEANVPLLVAHCAILEQKLGFRHGDQIDFVEAAKEIQL